MSHSQGNGTNTFCPMCGKPFNRHTAGKPKTYCSPECRNLYKYYSALEDTLKKISFNGKSGNRFKGDLFRLANTITCS